MTTYGKCLTLPFNIYATDSTQKLIIEDCNGSNNQIFNYNPNTKEIIHGAKCIGLENGNGTNVQVSDCNSNPIQKWNLAGNTIINLSNNKCMTSSAGNPAYVTVSDCNGNINQQFSFTQTKRVPDVALNNQIIISPNANISSPPVANPYQLDPINMPIDNANKAPSNTIPLSYLPTINATPSYYGTPPYTNFSTSGTTTIETFRSITDPIVDWVHAILIILFIILCILILKN